MTAEKQIKNKASRHFNSPLLHEAYYTSIFAAFLLSYRYMHMKKTNASLIYNMQ